MDVSTGIYYYGLVWDLALNLTWGICIGTKYYELAWDFVLCLYIAVGVELTQVDVEPEFPAHLVLQT